MNGNIFNSNGSLVGMVNGAAILDLNGQKLYELRGINIYQLSGELVGHLPDAHGTEKRRLDRSTDRLFPVKARRHLPSLKPGHPRLAASR